VGVAGGLAHCDFRQTLAFKRCGLLLLVVFAFQVFRPATALSASTSDPSQCAAGEVPAFSGDAARLHDSIGTVMGKPGSCVYEDPLGAGWTEQLTINGLGGQSGVVYSRSGDVTFTENYYGDQEHWALIGDRLLNWVGPSVEPTADAVPVDGCKAALAADMGNGALRRGLVWSGVTGSLGRFDNSLVVSCISSETFAGGNIVWCLLADDQPVPIDDRDSCLNAVSITREDDRTLLGVAQAGSLNEEVTRLRWTGSGFQTIDQFESCNTSQPIRVPPAISRDPQALIAFCGYTRD
jgi:hypothetical protein